MKPELTISDLDLYLKVLDNAQLKYCLPYGQTQEDIKLNQSLLNRMAELAMSRTNFYER